MLVNRHSTPVDQQNQIVGQPKTPYTTHLRSLFETAQVNDSSAVVRLRVARARERQGALNSALADRDFERVCPIGDEIRELLQLAAARVKLSARGLKRVLRVARTIADLEDGESVSVHHVSEALLYRSLDAAGLDTPVRPGAYHRPNHTRPAPPVH